MPKKIDPLNKKNYTAVTAALCVTDVRAAADFYQKAFGFQKRGIMNGPDGKPMHAELTLRGGPSVTYADPLRPERTKERSEWLLEVQARWPILAGIGLEYQGTAAPALTPLDKSWVNHDVRLAFPVGNTGKLRLGAKQRWEGVGEQRSAPEGPQLYLGLELVR